MRAMLCSLMICFAAIQAVAEDKKPPVATQLTADTPQATVDGATFVAPGGWWIETRGDAIILTLEGDSKISIVDVHTKDADEAVKSAWAIVRPDMKWALKLTTDNPGRNGWDSFKSYQ